MGMPSVSISFSEVAVSAITRGERGIIAMVVVGTVPETNPVTILSVEDIPSTFSADVQKQIKLALMGYTNAPKKVIVYTIESNDKYSDALTALAAIKFDYLVCPTATTDSITADVVSYVKAQRENGKLIKAILPNTAGDTEGVINYATDSVTDADGNTYTAEQYCSRIAGIIAGTPLTMSATYAPMSELADCTHLTKAEMDAAVDAGKFIVWFDGEKVKTARAVNSFTTLTSEKNTQFQKIKIVDAMDMITNDIKLTAEDNYLGKYPNTYKNKCLLVSAIQIYFDSLIAQGVLSSASVDIDIDANRSYMRLHGEDVDNMTDDEIRQGNTGSYVYLKATVKILDAIEDIVLPITI